MAMPSDEQLAAWMGLYFGIDVADFLSRIPQFRERGLDAVRTPADIVAFGLSHGLRRRLTRDGMRVLAEDGPTAQAEPTARGLGAKAWGDIRLVIRPGDGDGAGGLTFHCGGQHRAVSWADIGLGRAATLRELLLQLAAGPFDWGSSLDSRTRPGLEATRARELAAGRMRKNVSELNRRFKAQLPGLADNPFRNDGGVTVSGFASIRLHD